MQKPWCSLIHVTVCVGRKKKQKKAVKIHRQFFICFTWVIYVCIIVLRVFLSTYLVCTCIYPYIISFHSNFCISYNDMWARKEYNLKPNEKYCKQSHSSGVLRTNRYQSSPFLIFCHCTKARLMFYLNFPKPFRCFTLNWLICAGTVLLMRTECWYMFALRNIKKKLYCIFSKT